MDRFDAMSLFLSVVDEGGFSAAARARRVPVATVSRRIADLEAMLGARLLLRSTRKVGLTAAGEAYAGAARRILAAVRAAEEEALEAFTSVRGELVLSAPLILARRVLLPVVLGFMAENPDISIRVLSRDSRADLIEGDADLVLHVGELSDSSLIAARVGELRVVACCAPDLLVGEGAAIPPETAAALPHIAIDPAPSTEPRGLRGPGFGDLGAALERARLRVDSPEAALDAARQGGGVTWLLRAQAAEAIRAGELTSILEALAPPPLPVHLLHASSGGMPLKLRRFLDYAAPRLRRALQALA